MRGNAAVQGVPVKFASKLDAAADAVAAVVISGVAGVSHVLVGVEYSYSGDVGSGELAIGYDPDPGAAVTIKEVAVDGEDHWMIDFSQCGPMGGLPMPMGADLLVTLARGGVGVTGKVNITYR